MSELVQPIAVAKAGSHEQVVAAVARASALAWLTSIDCTRWGDWLEGRFTKSVRRGSIAKLNAIEEEGYAICRVAVQDAVAIGCLPMAYDEMPPGLLKLRVADFERERTGQWEQCTRGPRIAINADAEMSTGKTAAQVAHGLFGFLLKRSAEYRKMWMVELPLQVEVITNPDWRMALGDAEVVINDAGLTEVEPGTATVCVRQ